MEISVSQSKAIKKQLLGAIVPESSELGSGRSRGKSLERQQAFKQLEERNATFDHAAVYPLPKRPYISGIPEDSASSASKTGWVGTG